MLTHGVWLIAIVAISVSLHAQTSARYLPVMQSLSLNVQYSQPVFVPDSIPPADTSNTKNMMTKSPTGAVLRSLALPGWGQFYNESYFKAGMFAAAAVSIGSIIVWNHSRFVSATSRYDALTTDDPLRDRTFREKEFYRDQRDVAGLWMLGIYALSCVDAYVGAHLYNFDVSDSGVAFAPSLQPGGAGMAMQYRW
ncbi:MAG: hypothetical protein JNL32_05095 [Candidatus Kapabacteria bacterium]|nr:hypothetical protein [Candidatus Kapabacteria bacterium]